MISLRIAFIGAGQVNFGGGEGPWNHAKRLEEISNVNHQGKEVSVAINVVAIADPFVSFAEKVLQNQQQKTNKPEMWKDTKVFASYTTMINEIPNIDAVFIGVPPGSHGSVKAPNSIEVDCAAKGIHMLIEKPISCYPVDEVEHVAEAINKAEQEKGLIVSVAYMFRYNRVVQKMKEIIDQNGPVRVFNGRYDCAYANLNKEMWWDASRSGGPIVEQATHFCDLARYLVGDVRLNSVHALSIKQTDPLGKLSKLSPNLQNLEQRLPENNRIPRATAANWHYENGAIGTLTHGVLLHGNKYEAELEVWGDGYRMVLIEPYGKCKLSVRLPDSETADLFEFADDDMYLNEDKTFLEAIVNKDPSAIQSRYADSLKTYALTHKISDEAQKSL
jgi:predicted dehydrogenase